MLYCNHKISVKTIANSQQTLARCLGTPSSTQTESNTLAIKRLVLDFPQIISSRDHDLIRDEYLAYQNDDLSSALSAFAESGRADHFWRDVGKLKNSCGMPKYSNLYKLARTVLSIPHGNADVERSLSINKNILTSERTRLSEETLIGLRLRVKDAVRRGQRCSKTSWWYLKCTDYNWSNESIP